MLESGFELGSWRVEPRRNIILRGDEERHLENRLMQTLLFLVQHPGQVIPRQRFFDTVWQGLVVNEEALSRAISLLRSLLGDNPHTPKYIQTVPGAGYRLTADVVTAQDRKHSMLTVQPAQKNSIAVLPFVNLSDDPGNEYFSDGISEEILNALAQVRRFKIVGRTSSFAFKDMNKDIREIGRAMDVTHVLEGSVRKSGSRVRITAQLIKTDDGYHLWSQTFDHELDDIFAIQDKIASAVAKALKVKLLGDNEIRQSIGGTTSAKAFQYYLLGVHYRNRGADKGSLNAAIKAFSQAIETDPEYAKAYVGLAMVWSLMTLNSFVSYEEGLINMEAGVVTALNLNPGLAEAHLALGYLHFFHKQDLHGAHDAFLTALKLNPGNVEVQFEYARVICYQGHFDEAIAAARKALELDPVSLIANHFLGHILYFSRHYEEAITALRHTLEMEPRYPKPHYFIAMSLFWLGQIEAAWKEIQQEPLDWMRWAASAVILHRLNRIEEAKENLAEINKVDDQEFATIQRADTYAQWGDIELAFKNLELAVDYGDPGLAQLLVDPFLDPLREDQRFIELLKNLGFNPD